MAVRRLFPSPAPLVAHKSEFVSLRSGNLQFSLITNKGFWLWEERGCRCLTEMLRVSLGTCSKLQDGRSAVGRESLGTVEVTRTEPRDKHHLFLGTRNTFSSSQEALAWQCRCPCASPGKFPHSFPFPRLLGGCAQPHFLMKMLPCMFYTLDNVGDAVIEGSSD